MVNHVNQTDSFRGSFLCRSQGLPFSGCFYNRSNQVAFYIRRSIKKQENIYFNELCEAVLNQLRTQSYMDSTLTTYKRFYNRLHAFINERDSDVYTKEHGRS